MQLSQGKAEILLAMNEQIYKVSPTHLLEDELKLSSHIKYSKVRGWESSHSMLRTEFFFLFFSFWGGGEGERGG